MFPMHSPRIIMGSMTIFIQSWWECSSLIILKCSTGWDKKFTAVQVADRDGMATLNGKPQPVGTYVWLIKGLDYLGNIHSEKGTVVLIR